MRSSTKRRRPTHRSTVDRRAVGLLFSDAQRPGGAPGGGRDRDRRYRRDAGAAMSKPGPRLHLLSRD